MALESRSWTTRCRFRCVGCEYLDSRGCIRRHCGAGSPERAVDAAEHGAGDGENVP